MSYHNGSIWPHDNALIAAGMGRCGGAAKANTVTILTALLDASIAMDQHRLEGKRTVGRVDGYGRRVVLDRLVRSGSGWLFSSVGLL